MLTPSNCVSVWFGEVYSELVKDLGVSIAVYLSSLGYSKAPCVPNFRVPSLGDTYLTPDGKIATKEKGDKGPYGPRLIVVEDLTESERTYGKGIKTGADALAKCPRASYHALTAVGKSDNDMPSLRDGDKWEVVEFRKLCDKETCAFIDPVEFCIYGTLRGDSNHEAQGKPVYIVRPKQPRKKRVLVFDFDEVAKTTYTVVPNPEVGCLQWVVFEGLRKGKTGLLAGKVEEREAL
jgi:hypothetical protein